MYNVRYVGRYRLEVIVVREVSKKYLTKKYLT